MANKEPARNASSWGGPKAVLCSLRTAVKKVGASTRTFFIQMKEAYHVLPRIVGLENFHGRPSGETVMSSTVALVLFAIVTCVAVKVTTHPMRLTYGCVGCALSATITSIILDDLFRKRRRLAYKRNLANTCATGLFTIPLMTALYCFLWYPQLNRTIIERSEDTVTSVQFPAVTIFQRSDWTSQAKLLDSPKKCFIGWIDDKAPMCNQVNVEHLGADKTCNCNNSWSPEVGDSFSWQGSNYHYMSLFPSSDMIVYRPTSIMRLQAFFNYNVTASLEASTQEEGPSLYMAVYDPSLDIKEALDIGFTTMTLMAANGRSSINLGLVHRQKPDGGFAYDYALRATSVPNLSLVCNIDQNGSYPCFFTLVIQMPNFNRQIFRRRQGIAWLDVASSAGGYYALVQSLSWIISGQAFAP